MISKKPSILFLALFAALALTAHAEGEPSAPAANRLPDFSWDRVPLYMHIRKAKNFNFCSDQ
jgi:hypothetical protein